MEDHFMQANGITLHVVAHPGESPALVLLPGLTANARCFDGYVAAGLSPRFQVYALDLRGRGQSDKPESGYAIEDHAGDVEAFIKGLGQGPVILCGHSFGGLVAMYMAAHMPEVVSRLVVIDAAAELHPGTPELIQASLDRMGQTLPSWEAYLEAVKAQPQYTGWWDKQIETLYRADVEQFEDGSVRSRLYPAGILEAVEKGLQVDWKAICRRIEQPTLVLNAPAPYGPGRPPMISREQAEMTVELIADARYVEIPGHHITMLYGKGAGRTVQVITEFTAEI
jgi:pimeloyl-ACP methyl ester carboxylesterase